MAQYTRKAILYTFQEMLRQMPFDKITVSALVAKCEISSNTFYYHYRDIYDLLDSWFQIVVKEKYLAQLRKDWCLRDALKVLLRDMKANADLVYHLFNSLSRERLERHIFESTDDTFYQLVCVKTAGVSIPEEELRSVVEYNSYALLGFLLKFLWKNMSSDIDENVDRISRICEENIQRLIAQYGDE